MEPAELIRMLVIALGVFILNWIWYSPALFGKIWMKEVMGVTQPPKTLSKAQKAQMMRGIVLGFIFQVISVYVLAHFLFSMELANDFDGLPGKEKTMMALTTGLWIWLGFMLPLGMYAFLWEGKKLVVSLINAGSSLMAMMVSALLLTLWM